MRRALPAKLHALVEADAQQVALNLAQVQVDVHQLRTLLAEASVESLKSARKLAAEPLLEGFDARSGAFEECWPPSGGPCGASWLAPRRSSPSSAATRATRTARSTR